MRRARPDAKRCLLRVGSRRHCAGFTFAEVLVVLAITGIVAAVVAVFLRSPIQGYFDTTRRAQLSDEADGALRRITRDLRLALPNSVRVTSSGGSTYLELLLTKGGGRYRAEPDSTGGGNALSFTSAATPYRFDAIGTAPAVTVNSDSVVVFNLGPGFTGSDAYAASGNNRRLISAISGNTFTLTPATAFPQPSPGNRFQIIEGPVSYACTPNAAVPANGTLRRYSGYAIQAVQPTSFSSGTNALLVGDVGACSFTYAPAALAQRNGVVVVTLTLTQAATGGNESVTLLQEAHVSNVP